MNISFIPLAVAEEFFSSVVGQARTKNLLSDEHFTVDGTLIEAWAGQKSFQPKKEESGSQSHHRMRAAIRQCTPANRSGETIPICRLPIPKRCCIARTAKGAKLVFAGHLLTENRN
jgi:hypothetical protein